MKLLDQSFPNSSYEGQMNYVLNRGLIAKAFKKTNVGDRKSISDLLREFFDNKKISNKEIRGDSGILIKSPEITSSIVLEGFDSFERAIYFYYSQFTLAKKGFYTWAQVSNYYSSFFSAHALLKLQGRCITNIWRLVKPDGNISGTFCHIFPYDLTKNEFVVCSNMITRKSNHVATWKLYYWLYDRFQDPKPYFERIYKLRYTENNGFDEINFRNERNYRPLDTFEELLDPTRLDSIIKNYINNYEISDDVLAQLEMLTTDPKFKYFARSALRLLFTSYLIKAIVDENKDINEFWDDRRTKIRTFLEFVLPSISADGNLIEKIPTMMDL